MDDTTAVFPQRIHWEDKGTSRIPFMAYTTRRCTDANSSASSTASHWCYVGLEAEIPERRRLQAHGGRRALGDHGARRRRRRSTSSRTSAPTAACSSAASATATASELHLPLPPVELHAQGRPAGRAVPPRRQAGRQGQRRHAGRLQARRARPDQAARSRRAAAWCSRRSTPTSSRSRTSSARRSSRYFDRLFNGRKLKILGYNRQRIPGNWKLMQENIKDPYHPGLLHTWFVTFGLWRADNKSQLMMDAHHRHAAMISTRGSERQGRRR